MKDDMPDNPPDDSTGDAALLRRFAIDHSEAAFAAFVGRRIGFVYGAALRRTAGDAHLAREIAQTVFLVASQKASTLARHEQLAGWLHATTSLTARSALRDARLRRQREQEAAAMNALHRQPAPAAAMRMREMIDDALDLLGQKDRDALLLRFFEGRPFAEVGAAMKTNEDAARKRVARALEKLRALFARRGVTSTAAALSAFMTAEAATAAPAGLASSVSGAILAGGAAAAVTTTTAAGVLAFMTSTKIAITAAAVALLLATVATVEVRLEKSATADIAALKREHAALTKKLGSLQTQVKGQQTYLANYRREKAEAAEYVKNPHDHNPVLAGKAFLAQHPEIQELLNEMMKSSWGSRLYPLYKKLNLTPGQIAEFEEIYSKNPNMGGHLIFRNIPGIGKIQLNTTPSDVLPAQQFADGLKDLLGPENYKQMMARDPEPNAVEQLAKDLFFTDTPLTADQMVQFKQLFSEQMNAHRNNPKAYWDAAQKSAGAFLSEPQMAALKRVRDSYPAGMATTAIGDAPAAKSGKKEASQ